MKCSRIELRPSRLARPSAAVMCAGGREFDVSRGMGQKAGIVPASDGMDVVHGGMGPRGTGAGSWLAGRRLAVSWFRGAVSGVTKRGYRFIGAVGSFV